VQQFFLDRADPAAVTVARVRPAQVAPAPTGGWHCSDERARPQASAAEDAADTVTIGELCRRLAVEMKATRAMGLHIEGGTSRQFADRPETASENEPD
jgi:hypothetical protein